MRGRSVTILAYGPTGSGKATPDRLRSRARTHARACAQHLRARAHAPITDHHSPTSQEHARKHINLFGSGCISRSIRSHIPRKSGQRGRVSVSMLEIYGNKIYDLSVRAAADTVVWHRWSVDR